MNVLRELLTNVIRHTPAWLLTSALVVFAPLALAHHSWDPTRGMPIEWQGRIERVSWDGPHVMYRIQVTQPEQPVQSWQALGASPRILRRRGIKQASLRVGEAITVVGYLDPSSKLIGLKHLVTAEGRRYDMSFHPPPQLKAPALK